MIRAWAGRSQVSTPSPFFLFASPFASSITPPSSMASSQPNRSATNRSIRIAIVGDVHDDWDLEEDSKALHFLQPDLVLFTGDFGNENVELVRSISNLNISKAAILGNHDCWHTHQFSEKKVDRVRLQLECLGEQHVGYNRLDFPTLELSVVGGRPFSCGGDRLFRPRLLSARYGVNDMEESAKKIRETALGTPEGYSIVLLAHNGPTGLGSKASDICGRDWVYGGGDHGDPDLAQAMLDLKASTHLPIPLVVFGHMHKQLAYKTGLRKMVVVDPEGTIYLNGAIVPRVKKHDPQDGTSEAQDGTLRAFTLAEILNGRVEKISEVWVFVAGSSTIMAEESVLFKSS